MGGSDGAHEPRPQIEMPKIAKGQTLMKGRPITGEEFDRMLAEVQTSARTIPQAWKDFLTGLWLSGLRLDEGCNLSWDEEAPFMVDLSGKRPVFRIMAAAQKARRDELLPMTPDFADWLLKTFPEAERVGKVFKLTTTPRRQSLCPCPGGKDHFPHRRSGRRGGQQGRREVSPAPTTCDGPSALDGPSGLCPASCNALCVTPTLAPP